MSLTLRDVLVVIPALNEQDTVGDVVRAVRGRIGAAVLVIDDGSTDATADRARDAGAIVVSHDVNKGVGVALRSGFQFAVANSYGAAVQIDADGQHDPESAAELLAPVLDGRADLVIGSRFANGYDVGRLRSAGMKVLSRMVTRRIGQPITDTTSGFRAFSAAALQEFAESYPSRYLSDTVEAVLLAHDAGLRITELPAQMHDRQGGTPSAGPVSSAFHMLRLMIVLLRRPTRPASSVVRPSEG